MDNKELYILLHPHIQHAENVSWNRFNNYLLFNSIMLLAWVSLYTKEPLDPREVLVLATIPVLGIISGVFWAGLGYRGRKFLNTFIDLGTILEESMVQSDNWPNDKVKPCKSIKDMRDSTLPCKWAGSFFILVYGPTLFSLLYVLLFIVSVCRG